MNELKKNFDKYKDKVPSQLIKIMFHGSGRGAQANAIYESEDGLDIRFSRGGAAGQGIYFADNSAYSIGYCSSEQIEGQNYRCMFVCFVLPGQSIANPPGVGGLRIPPNLPNS